MVDIVELCANFCPVQASNGGGEVEFSSWIAVLLFVASEAMAYLDVEPNGLLQAVTGLLRKIK